ncbi:hypothetical protein ACSBR1_038001 [Camellia fascicularis]
MEDIRDEFERMSAFLKVVDAKEESDPELKVWIKQVLDAACDTEDVLDKFKLHLAHHCGNGFSGFLRGTCLFSMMFGMSMLWEAIKHVLPDNNSGSRVILTTRFTHIASTCCEETDGHVYTLMLLSQEESWTLFCNKTFGGKLYPPNLKQISHRIFKRCEGLSLAIVAISGVLATKDKSRIDEWEMLYGSLGAALGQ